MVNMNVDVSQSLFHAVEAATDGEVATVDGVALKAIKALCKASPHNCSAAADMLILRLQNESLQVLHHHKTYPSMRFLRIVALT